MGGPHHEWLQFYPGWLGEEEAGMAHGQPCRQSDMAQCLLNRGRRGWDRIGRRGGGVRVENGGWLAGTPEREAGPVTATKRRGAVSFRTNPPYRT